MRNLIIVFMLVMVTAVLAGCQPKVVITPHRPVASAKPPVTVEMDVKGKGKIVMELSAEKAPETTSRIGTLVKEGFYNGQRVHRVEGWVIQWGDPQSKEKDWAKLPVGTQGSGVQLPFEANDMPMDRGTVAMASTGAGVGGDSQIFILKQGMSQLQGGYAVFGTVTEGMEVADKIVRGDEIAMKVVEK
ncbi:MAG: peptidylprolyl isomerase [Armatimonadetes bacterium]|nr:peptidylprolyl isomerase [Armatimonadota bacterium]